MDVGLKSSWGRASRISPNLGCPSAAWWPAASSNVISVYIILSSSTRIRRDVIVPRCPDCSGVLVDYNAPPRAASLRRIAGILHRRTSKREPRARVQNVTTIALFWSSSLLYDDSTVLYLYNFQLTRMKTVNVRPFLSRPVIRRTIDGTRSYAVQTPGTPTLQIFNRNTKWLQKERAAANVATSRQADYLRDEIAMRLSERLLVR